MTTPTPPSKAQELADASFEVWLEGSGPRMLLSDYFRALAEAAYRLGQHDGWDEAIGKVADALVELPDTPYGGDK